MEHSEFVIGGLFWCSSRLWRCTDIGTRTIIAIRIDRVDVESTNPDLRRTLNQAEAENEGWLNGPPYAVTETVFDEYAMPGCSLLPDTDFPALSSRSSGQAPPEPSALFEIVKILEHARIHFFLERTRPDTIRVSATLVGERMEIDVFEDNHVEISRFLGNEAVEGGMDLLRRLVSAAE